jgi:hypothetical protein
MIYPKPVSSVFLVMAFASPWEGARLPTPDEFDVLAVAPSIGRAIAGNTKC